MRPGLFAALVVALALASAASASADQRFASPTGSGESCSQGEPCSLGTAVGMAESADEVIVGAGLYTVETSLKPGLGVEDVYIHGELGSAMPRIVGGAEFGTLIANGGPGGRIEYLEVVATKPYGNSLACGKAGRIDRVRATTTGQQSAAIIFTGSCAIRDSLALTTGENSIAVAAYGNEDFGDGLLRNVTAISSGGKSVGVASTGPTAGSQLFTLDVKNSIARGIKSDIETRYSLGGLGHIAISHSNFVTPAEPVAGSITQGGGNQSVAPQFVNAAGGDYAEASGSPTIDAGSADQLGALDLFGLTRVLGPAPDIGAYEFVPAPPSARLLSLKVAPRKFRSISVGESTGGGVLKSKPPVRTGVSYSLSAAATISFSVERKLKGRRAGKRCVKQTAANRGKKRCARFVRVKGGFTFEGAAGEGRFTFTGKIGGKPLKKGGYRLVGSAGGTTERSPFAIAGVFRPAPK